MTRPRRPSRRALPLERSAPPDSPCPRRCLALLLGASLALGCGSDDGPDDGAPPPSGGQTGEETFGCQPVSRDGLAWSERSPLGFSADELLAALGGEVEARLAWSEGGSTPLTLTIERQSGGSVEFQEREFVSDGSGAELAAAECGDVVAIPITLSFSTADGAFAESWPVTLLAESTARVTAYARVDVEELAGSFSVTQVDPSRFAQVIAIVDVAFADGGWSGSVSGQAISQSSGGPDGTTSATLFAIASF